MVRNDYYNMKVEDVRTVIGICEKDGVASIAIEGYEWLMHKGLLRKGEYLRLSAHYRRVGDLSNCCRVLARYAKQWGKKAN